MKCKARHIYGQMKCFDCGLVWDMDDRDPPQCKHKIDARFDTPAPKNITEIREKYEQKLQSK